MLSDLDKMLSDSAISPGRTRTLRLPVPDSQRPPTRLKLRWDEAIDARDDPAEGRAAGLAQGQNDLRNAALRPT